MSIYQKLLMIQKELRAPKGQVNTFGNYRYRSCEDILEAVKPLCAKYGVVLTVSDEIICVGDRYYIKATSSLVDTETNEAITNTAFARECTQKKGMDEAQITGATSSYARKYSLNGIFCIDDTKDSDTDAYHIVSGTDEPKYDTADVQSEPQPADKNSASEIHCEKCNRLITSNKVLSYSRKRFAGHIYCYNCGREMAA